MIRELRAILSSFSPRELELLARSHLGEAVRVLEEAVQSYEGRPDEQLISFVGRDSRYAAGSDWQLDDQSQSLVRAMADMNLGASSQGSFRI